MALLNTTAVLCLYNGEGGTLIFCMSVEGWGEDTRYHICLHADKTSKIKPIHSAILRVVSKLFCCCSYSVQLEQCCIVLS